MHTPEQRAKLVEAILAEDSKPEAEPIDNGGNAFPAMLPGGNYCTTGMSLLDYFAGQAVAGMLALEHMYADAAAMDAYKIAQAMLKERKRLHNG